MESRKYLSQSEARAAIFLGISTQTTNVAESADFLLPIKFPQNILDSFWEEADKY